MGGRKPLARIAVEGHDGPMVLVAIIAITVVTLTHGIRTRAAGTAVLALAVAGSFEWAC